MQRVRQLLEERQEIKRKYSLKDSFIVIFKKITNATNCTREGKMVEKIYQDHSPGKLIDANAFKLHLCLLFFLIEHYDMLCRSETILALL